MKRTLSAGQAARRYAPTYRVLGIAVPGIVAAVVLAAGLIQLYGSHPHEDAYITFTYVENFAEGHGIVFYPGGPRAEGATAFLWTLILSGPVYCGFDVAVAAAVLNALGGFLAAYLFERHLPPVEEGGAPTLALALFPLVLPFFGGALSAYLGFSSMLYGAIALVLLVLAIDEENRASAWIPALGLVVALLRPDGVAIGVGFTLLGLWHAAQTDRLVPYLAAAATAACAGVVYFAARYAYFGLLLPLPLYVKGQGAMRGPLADRIVHVLPWLRGIAGDLSWLKSAQGPAPLLCAGALLALVLPRSGRREALRMGQALIPFALFLALLALAFQHQNVHFRFQAPALLAIVFVVFRLAALALRGPRARRLGIVALLWLAIAPAVFAGGRAIVANWNCRSYIDQFPARLATILDPNRSIALTEAGRLPYWVRTRTYDIPGLNDPDTAHGPATLEYIEGIQPDIVMFNASYAYRLRPPREGPARKFVLLAASSLSRAVSPPFRRAFEDGCADGQLTSVQAAPVLLGRYLIDHQDAYALALVRYKGMGAHVYGIRKSLPEATEILRALEDSTSGRTYASYAALKHFPGARRFDAAIDAAAKPTGSPRG